MPFSIIIKDVSEMSVDALVNSTNRHMIPGGRGVDYCIHKAAGPELDRECLKLAPCELAEVKITQGYGLPCKMILHTVGPRWDGTQNCIDILRRCYENVLSTAVEHGCESIAIPLISSGYKDFPRAVVLQTATEVSKEFLEENDLWIYLNVYRKEEFPSAKEFSFREEVQHKKIQRSDSYVPFAAFHRRPREEDDMDIASMDGIRACPHPMERATLKDEAPSFKSTPLFHTSTAVDFDNMKVEEKEVDKSFGQMVSYYVDRYFDKTSHFYVAANITKAVYSKMKCSPDYKPSRSTALACAVVLEEKGVDANELLSYAGMMLTSSDKRDIIIRAALAQNIYKIDEINIVLYKNNLPLLGYKV